MYEIGEKTETILSSLQACFMITHSSEDFIVKNIHNHHLYNLQNLHKGMEKNFNALFNCYTVMLCVCGGMMIEVGG